VLDGHLRAPGRRRRRDSRTTSPGVPGGRGPGRSRRSRTGGDARISGAAAASGRVLPHRRSRRDGCSGTAHRPCAPERSHRQRRREHLSRRGGGSAARTPGGARCGGAPRLGRRVGADRRRVRRDGRAGERLARVSPCAPRGAWNWKSADFGSRAWKRYTQRPWTRAPCPSCLPRPALSTRRRSGSLQGPMRGRRDCSTGSAARTRTCASR